MTMTEFMSLDALAGRLALPRAYLRRLAREGVIPALHVGRWMRFDEGAVREALHELSLGNGDGESGT